MPKEIVKRTGNSCFADVMVRWSKSGDDLQLRGGDARVDLFMISKDGLGNVDGGFWFEPNDPTKMNLPPNGPDGRNQMVGPVSVDLNRAQLNRLIRVLRTARDQAYGRDE